MDFRNNMVEHQRKSIRLKDYDYSQSGVYFVTICTKDRECILGEINCRGNPCGCPLLKLSPIGEIVQKCWLEIPDRIGNVQLDKCIIMPNHIHGIIIVAQNERAGASPAPTLGGIIGSFKSLCVHRCIENHINITKLWQRNYYEHVIRDEEELRRIREYIINNPLKWELDYDNPERKKEYNDFTDYLKTHLKNRFCT